MKKVVVICFLFISSLIMAQINVGDDGLYYDTNNNVFTGVLTERFDNGNLKMRMNILDGKIHGYVEYFFKNGQIQEVRAYENGLKDGTWKTWNEFGVLLAEANYSSDLKDGKWMVWDDNGVKRYEMEYKQGMKIGMWYVWNKSGELIDQKDFNPTM